MTDSTSRPSPAWRPSVTSYGTAQVLVVRKIDGGLDGGLDAAEHERSEHAEQ